MEVRAWWSCGLGGLVCFVQAAQESVQIRPGESPVERHCGLLVAALEAAVRGSASCESRAGADDATLIWTHPGWHGRSPHRDVLAAYADEALELVDLTDNDITRPVCQTTGGTPCKSRPARDRRCRRLAN
jgi:hypothetical protein